MYQGFQTYTIDDLCIKITDGSHFSPVAVEDGYLMASSKDMTDYGWDFSDIKKISKSDYDKLVKGDCKPLKDDVLIIKDGANYLKHTFVIKEEIDLVILSSIAILRPDTKKIDPVFFAFLLKSPHIMSAMSNYVSGAAIPRIVLSDFKKIKINVPELRVQKRIASILTSYDELIENNNKRIAILEQMAGQVYKEWFVRMRFPGHEKVKMIKGVPEGWEIRSFSSLAKFVNGFAFKPSDWNTEGLPIIKINELKNGVGPETPRNSGIDVPARNHIRNGSILFSWSAHLEAYYWSGGDALLNQHAFEVIPNKDIEKMFIYFSLRNSMNFFRSLSNGATMQHIKKSALDQVKILYPKNDLPKRFSEVVLPILKQIQLLNAKNTNLRKTRDLLLPRLISGKLSVEKAEKLMKEEMTV
jgi:type I restriction enzyme, S subunit